MAKCLLICVGSELLRGKVSTHGATIARRLMSVGMTLEQEVTLPDNETALIDAIRQGLSRFDVVFVTGGLGPTFDDLSREAAAAATGRSLIRSPDLLRRIQAQFRKARYRKMPPANARQADLLEGADSIPNANGTAPGQWVDNLILLPGPPREMIPMLDGYVVPRLRRRFRARPRAEGHLHFVGIPESLADQKIRPVLNRFTSSKKISIDYTILASPGLVDFDVFVEADSVKEAQRQVDRILFAVRRPLRSTCFGMNEEYPLEKVIGDELRRRKSTVAVAESCTGGLLAGKLTDLAGSSRFFLGGVVAYSNSVKSDLLGIPPSLIKKEGAVSEAVARAMAEATRMRFKSTYAISITGIAGPDGGTPLKPVGLVYVAMASARRTTVCRFQMSGARDSIRTRSVIAALDLLRIACQKETISLE